MSQFKRKKSANKYYRKDKKAKKKRDIFREVIPLRKEQIEQLQKPFAQHDFIVFDIETTGGNPEKNGITEIAALKWRNGEIVERFYSMVNPETRIPPIVRKMTGITYNMVKDAPKIDEVMPGFLEFMGHGILVSHNIIGDLKFLRYFAKQTAKVEIPNLFLCTHLLSERLFPDSPNKSLSGLASFLGLSMTTVHRAQEDADLTLGLFLALLAEVKDMQLQSLEDLIRFQRDLESGLRLGWPFREEHMADAKPSPGCIVLRDINENILFVCAGANMHQLLHQMQKFKKLPKQVLRLLLRSKTVEFKEAHNFFEALLWEADYLSQHKTLPDPLSWKQRYINIASFVKKDEGVSVKIEPYTKSVSNGLGSIADVAKFNQALQEFFTLCGKDFSGKGGVLQEAEASDLSLLLTHGVEEASSRLGFKWFYIFAPGQFMQYWRRKSYLRKLTSLKVKPSLHEVSDINGFYFVPPRKKHVGISVYEVVKSQVVAKVVVQNTSMQDLIESFNERRFHRAKSRLDVEGDTHYFQRSIAWAILQKNALFIPKNNTKNIK